MPRSTYRKIITSEERINQILPGNKKFMEEFLEDKAVRLSEKSIVVYRSNLNIFFCWNLIHNNNKLFTDIRKIEFSKFFTFLSSELQLGSSKMNNMRSTLSSLSSFIEKFYDEDYPNFRNVILNVIESSPKEARREKTILTNEQVESLLEHLSKKDSQQACWLALAICSGARFSELLSFTTDLIDENRTAFGNIFLETTKKIKTKGRGKSGKLLHKYILKDKFIPYYNAWMKDRAKILKKNKVEDHGFLFINKNGQPASSSIVRKWIAEFEEYLKVPFYAHALRHYLTTMLSTNNIPHIFIKEIFGWSSLEMVDIYDDSTAASRYIPELENLKGL